MALYLSAGIQKALAFRAVELSWRGHGCRRRLALQERNHEHVVGQTVAFFVLPVKEKIVVVAEEVVELIPQERVQQQTSQQIGNVSSRWTVSSAETSATVTSYIHQEEEEQMEEDIFAVKEVCIRADPVCLLFLILNSSNRFLEMVCREVKMRRRREGKITRVRNSQGMDLKIFEGNSQGRDPKILQRSPSIPSPKNQNEKKREKCIPQKEKKKDGGESHQERWRDKEDKKTERWREDTRR